MNFTLFPPLTVVVFGRCRVLISTRQRRRRRRRKKKRQRMYHINWKGCNGKDTADLIDAWAKDCGGRKSLVCPNCFYTPWSSSVSGGRTTRIDFYDDAIPDHHERCELSATERASWRKAMQEKQRLLARRVEALRNAAWRELVLTIGVGAVFGLLLLPLLCAGHNYLHSRKNAL
jgi:hypothetical protein